MNFLTSLRTLILALVLSIGISYTYAAVWSSPSVGPTGDNTDAPINVGTATQLKDGGLGLGRSGFPALLDVVGNVVVSGNVGIGDATPDGSLKLDVEGQVGATQYCDQNGNNCTAATALGGGGGLVKYSQAVHQCPVSPPPGGTCSGGVVDLCSGQLSTVLTSCRQYTGGCLLSFTPCNAVGYIVQ